jgi:hypothetical protein
VSHDAARAGHVDDPPTRRDVTAVIESAELTREFER